MSFYDTYLLVSRLRMLETISTPLPRSPSWRDAVLIRRASFIFESDCTPHRMTCNKSTTPSISLKVHTKQDEDFLIWGSFNALCLTCSFSVQQLYFPHKPCVQQKWTNSQTAMGLFLVTAQTECLSMDGLMMPVNSAIRWNTWLLSGSRLFSLSINIKQTALQTLWILTTLESKHSPVKFTECESLISAYKFWGLSGILYSIWNRTKSEKYVLQQRYSKERISLYFVSIWRPRQSQSSHVSPQSVRRLPCPLVGATQSFRVLVQVQCLHRQVHPLTRCLSAVTSQSLPVLRADLYKNMLLVIKQ